MYMKLSIPPAHQDITDLIFKHHGYIWGGYVRDLIAGVSPNDLDIAISDEDAQAFYEKLDAFGYASTDSHTWNKSGSISIDIVENDDGAHSEHTIEIVASLDYDVNGLAYDGERVFVWGNPEYDPMLIVQAIHDRIATPICPTERRIAKMSKKGYTISF